jgi:hypothetical protein
MNTLETKWQANKDKVAFAKVFPGMLRDEEEIGDRELRDDILIDQDRLFMARIFTDGSFLIEIEDREPYPEEILVALASLREHLEPFHREAYATLDELTTTDRELTRQARKENILGAIRNNIAMIPELYEEIPKLLEELRDGGGER